MSHTWCPTTATITVHHDTHLPCCEGARHRKIGRVWFWAPQLYWWGWKTLLPVWFSGDEYGRRTIVVGWNFTGCMIVAMWVCGCIECNDAREQTAAMEREDPDD